MHQLQISRVNLHYFKSIRKKREFLPSRKHLEGKMMGGLRKVGRPPHCFRFYQTKDPSYGANPTTPGKMKTYIKKKRKTLPRQKIRHMGPTLQLLEK